MRPFMLFFVMIFLLGLSSISYAQDDVASSEEMQTQPLESVETVIDRLKQEDENISSEEMVVETPISVKVKEELPEPVDTLTGDPQIEEMVRRIGLYDLDFNLSQIGSLFFTSFELNLIEDARKGLVTRAPTEEEVIDSIKDIKEGRRPAMGPRELALGGIVYVSSSDWTIWLNSEKITPDRLPPEILDISVYKNYIKIKWFDAYTNQIFPIKIKPQQRFNIDTRIFLPG